MGMNRASRGLGIRQTWKDLTASRANNTTYYNSTPNPIEVCAELNLVTSGHVSYTVTVDGVVILKDSGTSDWYNSANLTFTVPANSSYSINSNSGIRIWSELS